MRKSTVPTAPTIPPVDPLVGGDPLPKAAPAPAAATVPATKTSKAATLPALPASSSSASTAAMAIGEPLSGGRTTLAIDDKNMSPGGAWQGPGGVTPASGQAGPVQLQRPEPIVDPVQRPTPVPLPPAGPTGVTPASYSATPGSMAENEQLQAQLKTRGVTWQNQQVVAEGIKFTCAVPNRHNPDITRLYEATAGDLGAAVRAVLQQIDEQH
jgi:hypothetical protein